MKKTVKYLLFTALLLVVGLVGWHLIAGTDHTKAGALPAGGPDTVAAARVERRTLDRTIRLSAEFRAYQEIDLHAKVAGFVQSIPVDIGDIVKTGGTIATLEIPELQEDLKKAQAGVDAASEAVKEADANYQGVHLDFTRLQEVSKEHPKFVAAQELDNARAKDQSAAAGLANAKQRVGEAQAEQKRQAAMVDYSKITAPFNGVVTKRYADVGALIQAGTSSSVQASAIVRFAQEDVLRVMFPVPESAAATVQNGIPVKIEVSGLDRTLHGNVTRFARQLNPETRTMETEVDIPNDDLSVTPGMFGWAILTLEEHKDVLSVPVEAVYFFYETTLYVFNKDHKIEDRAVKIGMETPNQIEIVSGLNVGDLVFIGNRSQVHIGTQVNPKVIDPAQIAYKPSNG